MINNTIIEANKEGRKATVFALAHPTLYTVSYTHLTLPTNREV